MTKFYICKECGNIAQLIDEGLACCNDEPMVELKANTVDASFEKHIPIVEIKDGVAKVTVGSVEHPMTEEHYIKWIYIKCDTKGSQRTILKPGMKPEASFNVADAKNIEVYAYCNLHGLWKADIQ